MDKDNLFRSTVLVQKFFLIVLFLDEFYTKGQRIG